MRWKSGFGHVPGASDYRLFLANRVAGIFQSKKDPYRRGQNSG